jgi:hypothetical protein
VKQHNCKFEQPREQSHCAWHKRQESDSPVLVRIFDSGGTAAAAVLQCVFCSCCVLCAWLRRFEHGQYPPCSLFS